MGKQSSYAQFLRPYLTTSLNPPIFALFGEKGVTGTSSIITLQIFPLRSHLSVKILPLTPHRGGLCPEVQPARTACHSREPGITYDSMIVTPPLFFTKNPTWFLVLDFPFPRAVLLRDCNLASTAC